MHEGLLLNVLVSGIITAVSFLMAIRLNRADFASRIFRYFWFAAGFTYLFDVLILVNSYANQITAYNLWNSLFYWLSHLAGAVSLALIPVLSLYLLTGHRKIAGVRSYCFPLAFMLVLSAVGLYIVAAEGWSAPEISTYDLKLVGPETTQHIELVLLLVAVLFAFSILGSLRQVSEKHMKYKIIFITASLVIYLVCIVAASLSTSSIVPRAFVSLSVLSAYLAFFRWGGSGPEEPAREARAS